MIANMLSIFPSDADIRNLSYIENEYRRATFKHFQVLGNKLAGAFYRFIACFVPYVIKRQTFSKGPMEKNLNEMVLKMI